MLASSFSRSTRLSTSVESYPLLSLGVTALSKVVVEIWEEMLVEVLRVPLLRLGEIDSLRDLGMLSPSLSLSRRRCRVFSTWEGQKYYPKKKNIFTSIRSIVLQLSKALTPTDFLHSTH